MFYIYDIDGMRFKGPMEALEQQRKVVRPAPVSAIHQGEQAAPFPSGPGARAIDVYRQASEKENMVEPLVYIHQIMTTGVVTVTRGSPLIEAWHMLQQYDIRQLVVVSEKNEVVGMLTDKDILRRLAGVDEKVDIDPYIHVVQIMQAEIITTDSMSDIRRVAKVMAYYHVDAMPVMRDGERLVGIVTRGDILRGFAENPKLNLWG